MAVMVEDREKQGQPTPAPAPSAARPGVMAERAARAGVVLAALSWGATLAYGLSALLSMGNSLTSTGPALRPGGLAAGAGLAVFLGWLGLKRFGSHLRYAQPGLGRWARGLALLGVGVMAVFGATAFYRDTSVSSTSLWWLDIAVVPVLGMMLRVKAILFASTGMFFTAMVVSHVLLNREPWAVFLIETEGEAKKVSWPARKEYVGSAFVVVLVISVVSVFLWLADEGLSSLLQKLKIGF